MLFDIPFLADWNEIGDHRQRQTDRNTEHENKSCIDWDYKIGDSVLLRKEGILQNQKANTIKILRLYRQSIRMVLSGFTTEQNQKD
eukprot:CCRYP_004033-RA/>CCRYP_004033-RA protein AED:0.39 eAED:0.39 QI:0/-1/0/1/-1/0/1/0/85